MFDGHGIIDPRSRQLVVNCISQLLCHISDLIDGAVWQSTKEINHSLLEMEIMVHGAWRPTLTALMVTTIMASSALADNSDTSLTTRFSIIETANGFLRLDQLNGNISICKAENAQMSCKLAANERHAYQKEIDRITRQLDKMNVRIDALEGRKSTAKLKPNNSDTIGEEEFDRALKFADKAFRHFFGMVQELKKESKKDAI
jgi:hypothetical protein